MRTRAPGWLLAVLVGVIVAVTGCTVVATSTGEPEGGARPVAGEREGERAPADGEEDPSGPRYAPAGEKGVSEGEGEASGERALRANDRGDRAGAPGVSAERTDFGTGEVAAPEIPTGRRPLPPAARAFSEVRALWVVRGTLARPASARAMVRRAHEAGFNTLIVQIRGRGDAYYDSRIEPRAEALDGAPARYDPLATVLQEAHARGLAVHVWMNVNLVGGLERPRSPDHLVNARPDLLAVPRDLSSRLRPMNPRDPAYVTTLLEWSRRNTRTVEGLYASPSRPEVREHLRAVWRDVLERYQVDGLHLDYIRYPSRAFDYSDFALRDFREWAEARVDAPRLRDVRREAAGDLGRWPELLPGPWDAYRREAITRLVRELRAESLRLRPDLTLSAAVFADAASAYRQRFQDWGTWMDEGWLDVLVPMAYTDDPLRFSDLVERAVARAGDPDRVWAGIGAWLNTLDGTVSQIAWARRAGARGIVLFSYDWMAAREAKRGRDWLERIEERAFGL